MAKTKTAEQREHISVPIQMRQVDSAEEAKNWERVVSIGAESKSAKVAMHSAEKLAVNARFDEFTEMFELRRIKEAEGKRAWMVVSMTGVNTSSDRVAMAAAEALINAGEIHAALYLGLSTHSDKARAYIDDELQKRKKETGSL